jgi:putative toxin-antitoxin system antitoxin component (TIGR02293 family)
MMNAFAAARDLAGVLGLPGARGSYTFLDLDSDVRRGLPVGVLDRVWRLMSPEDPAFRYLLVRKATLARRAKAPEARLSSEESDRIVRLAGIWQMALVCWKTEGAARAFLKRPHILLDGRTPLAVAAGSEVGAGEVERILGALIHGSPV